MGEQQPPGILPSRTARGRSARVRAYTITGGRTHTRHHLQVETMISVPSYDPEYSARLLPEAQAVYEHAHEPVCLAELAARLEIPLGVLRVLVSDLAADGAVFIHPAGHVYEAEDDLLERILTGLRGLPT